MTSQSTTRRRFFRGVLVMTAIVAIGPACAKRKPKEVNPITVEFEVNRTSAPLKSIVEVTYTWSCEPGMRKVEGDYHAFVHFLADKKTVLFGDDHVPTPPVASWEPGKSYSYKRTIFIPPVSHIGDVKILMGLYDPQGQGDRIALKGKDFGNQAYEVAQMELIPQTENIYVINKSGWHNPEAEVEQPGVERIWTKREAIAQFRNPNAAGGEKKDDVLVYLEADTNHKAFTQPPVLTVSIGASGVALPIESSDLFLKRIRFRADQMGEAEYVDLKLAMNQSFVPRNLGLNDDDRELGIRVKNLFVVEASRVGDLPKGDVIDAAPLAAKAKADRPTTTAGKRK